jgi:hypothetical protein
MTLAENAYLLELKTINIFNSNTSKVYLFKTDEDAYNFAIKLEPLIKKNKIYSMEYSLINNIIWESNPTIFPKYICEIKKINNDIIWGLMSCNTDTHAINFLYKNLKINNIIV